MDQRQLAILIDPDKMSLDRIEEFILKVNTSFATHIFVGGSEVKIDATEVLVQEIKKHTKLPVILFPGDITQITNEADGILLLSLISGRNSDYLIGKHVNAVPKFRDSNLNIMSTGYLLIENGKETSVERISKTKPIPRAELDTIVNTAKAGEYLGMKHIYLEAGSGATHPIDEYIITAVKNDLTIPLIVGGGLRSLDDINTAYEAGADLVVVGTAIEEDDTFFDRLKRDKNLNKT